MSEPESTERTPSLPQPTAVRIAELIRAGEAGDRARFDALFERCIQEVYAIAWAMAGDQPGAQEITRRFLVDVFSRRR